MIILFIFQMITYSPLNIKVKQSETCYLRLLPALVFSQVNSGPKFSFHKWGSVGFPVPADMKIVTSKLQVKLNYKLRNYTGEIKIKHEGKKKKQ